MAVTPLLPWEAAIPPSSPAVDLARWLTLRDLRAGLARRALRRPKAANSLLQAWSWADRPDVLSALGQRLAVARSPQTRALAVWAFGDPPEPPGQDMAEAELDRLALEAAVEEVARLDQDDTIGPIPQPALQAAGLYLLARLGEELRLRERQAWADAPFPADPCDARVRVLWSDLFDRGFQPEVVKRVRARFGREVRRAFLGVSLSLGLPPVVAQRRGEQALEALETLSWDTHLDLASRVVETAGEPVSSLGAVLDAGGWEQVAASVNGRPLWSEAWTLLVGQPQPDPAALSPGLLVEGVELVAALRLLAALSEGSARLHSLGLPGWGIVVADRVWIRGRLRVVAGQRPRALREAVLAMPSLSARTSAALSHFAWGWAWREARTGFDPESMQPPGRESPYALAADGLEPGDALALQRARVRPGLAASLDAAAASLGCATASPGPWLVGDLGAVMLGGQHREAGAWRGGERLPVELSSELPADARLRITVHSRAGTRSLSPIRDRFVRLDQLRLADSGAYALHLVLDEVAGLHRVEVEVLEADRDVLLARAEVAVRVVAAQQ